MLDPSPASIPSEALTNALAVLEFGDFQSRWEAAKLFPAFGETAIAPLLTFLRDPDQDAEVRWFAARILGEFDHPKVVAELAEVLSHTQDEDLCRMAAEALTNLGDSAVDLLMDLLAETTHRIVVVRALAQIRSAKVISPLLAVVEDPDPLVREIAIEALGSFHDPRIPPILLHALKDPASAVRIEAISTLGLRQDLLDQYPLIHALQACLWDVNLEVCCRAATALGRLGTDAAVITLAPLLKSTTPSPLQIAALQALSWIPSSLAVHTLTDQLSQTSTEIQTVILEALGRIDTPTLRPTVVQALHQWLTTLDFGQTSPRLLQSLALSLGNLGHLEALPTLTALLAIEDEALRLHVIAALKQLAPKQSLTHLHHLLNQPQLSMPLQTGIQRALQEW